MPVSLTNVDPGLINPCLLIWGCPRFWWGFITFGGEHPHINKQGLIHPGSTLWPKDGDVSHPRGADPTACLVDAVKVLALVEVSERT